MAVLMMDASLRGNVASHHGDSKQQNDMSHVFFPFV